MPDCDFAIEHVVHAAFGHADRRCSATSLLIPEQEVYEDELFPRAACDAVQSVPVGSAWDLETVVGPLIRRPRADEATFAVLRPSAGDHRLGFRNRNRAAARTCGWALLDSNQGGQEGEVVIPASCEGRSGLATSSSLHPAAINDRFFGDVRRCRLRPQGATAPQEAEIEPDTPGISA
jgi:hypothetical protein